MKTPNNSATEIENSKASRSDHPGYYWDNEDECFRNINTDARIEGNPPVIKFADRRAMALGAEDKRVNGINPDFTGIVVINGAPMRVLRPSVFNGILHYGILGKIEGEAVVGWIPACLCEVPDVDEAARMEKYVML